MLEKWNKFISLTKDSDLRRLVILGIFLLIISQIDRIFTFDGNMAFLTAVLNSTSVVIVVAAVSHVVRRVLFPKIHMMEFANKAKENPIAAAIVYLGVCIVLATFVVVNVNLLR
jgi:hypothetical protein|nr:MAG TPA: hypothetical protein [Caudoviricetes sp.]DAV42637.1 MAG TPA: hypothetical protein [Caudoviricetes sp.]